MIHSLHYATMHTLIHHGSTHPDDIPWLEPWLEAWHAYVSGSHLKAYLHAMKNSPLVPADRTELSILLHCFQIHRAVHALGDELKNRLDWVDGLLRECSG